jgi:thiol-disulfide isomerase/thioredoxin
MGAMIRRFNPVPVVLLVIPLLGIIGALLTIASSGGFSTTPPTPLPVTLAASRLEGRAAPNFELPTLDGLLQDVEDPETIRLSSLRGRLVFVNFWATWCEPCVRELPAFEQFVTGEGEDGAVILAVNIGEGVQDIETFLTENDVNGIPVLVDTTYRTQMAYDAKFFPSTFVIDKAGVVRDQHTGEMTLTDLYSYVEQFGDS